MDKIQLRSDQVATIREEAMNLLKSLPESCSWDDIMYEIYVKMKIDEGLKAAEEGRVVSHEDVRKRFLA